MASATHHAFLRCGSCDGAGMVTGSASGQPGETVTIVSEGTCPRNHKLTDVVTVVLD